MPVLLPYRLRRAYKRCKYSSCSLGRSTSCSARTSASLKNCSMYPRLKTCCQRVVAPSLFRRVCCVLTTYQHGGDTSDV
eukprot:3188764-Pleurochrysis_carterae.AAC.3